MQAAGISSLSRRNSDSAPMQAGSIQLKQRRDEIEYKQKVLNVKQGKAFNDKMLHNMSKKKLSTVDLQEDLLISDTKPVNAVSKHSLAARKESTFKMMGSGS